MAVKLLEECVSHHNIEGHIGTSLLIELSRLFRESGRTVEAIPILDQATNLEGLDTYLMDEINRERERVYSSLDEMDELRQYMVAAEESICQRLRGSLAGKRLVIIGGWQQPWAETIRADLALDKIEWKETEKNQRADYSDLKASLNAGTVDVVVLIWTFISHAGLASVKELAKRQHVPMIEAQLGLHSVLTALDRQFYPEQTD